MHGPGGRATRDGSLRLWMALVWALVAACGDIAATNPYDPKTPSEQQVDGRVRGSLRLIDEANPEALFDQSRLSTGVVRLVSMGASTEVLAQVAPDSEGAFTFEDVTAGDYVVRAHVDGFRDVDRAVTVEIGEDFQVGELVLPAINSPESIAFLVGKAQRGDAPADGHGGIRVQVLGTPWQAETEDPGTFRVAVSPGLYDLSFASAGYGTETATNIRAVSGQEVQVPDVVLQSRPGGIVGQIVLTSPDAAHDFTDADRLAVVLTLTDLDRMGVEPRVANPTADGRFGFDDVPAGHYALSADAQGFIGAQASADVDAGETRNVGAIHLEARIDARLFGFARRRCAAEPCNHAGIVVETVGRPFVAVTGSDGRYLLAVSAGPYELRFTLEGHRQSPDPVRIEAGLGEMQVPDVEMVPLPATVQGVVAAADGTGVVGATVSLLASDDSVVTTETSGEGGAVRFETEAASGAYTLRATYERHLPVSVPVALGPGRLTDFGRVVLPLEPGRVTGHVSRSDDAPRGGATLLVEGNPADPVTAAVRLRVATSPPDDGFDFALPAGEYFVTPLAPDYITPPAAPLVVPVGEAANLELALMRRTHEVVVPAVIGRGAEARFLRDPDLVLGRVWWDTDDPPDDLPLLPLDGPDADRLTFDVGDDNRLYSLRFQLANEQFLADPSDPYAALTPVLTANAVLDTDAPVVHRVEIAGGAPVVHSLIVPITIAATGAETVAVWNAPDADCAGAPSCGDEPFVPFTGTVVHTLAEAPLDQPQTVCWRACDAVCNCTEPASGTTVLGTFRERPTPVLSELSPEIVDVHEARLVTLTGEGLAHDTVAVVDAIELPCEGPRDAGRDCRADGQGACLDTCVIDLSRPEAGALRDNAGTYAVRLRTPAPVAGGEDLSDPLFLIVQSGLPLIDTMTPRGITVADLSDPDLRGLLENAEFDRIDFSRVFPDRVEVELRVCDDADNAQFRLGLNVGTVDPDWRRELPPEGHDGPCAGKLSRVVKVTFDTERIVDLPEAEQVVAVLNPSPGGGTGTAPFGITNVVDGCLADGDCVAALTARRPLDGMGLATYFATRTRFGDQFSGLAWRGGDAGVLHWRYREEDVPGVLDDSHIMGQVAARVTPETAGGVLPAILGQPFSVTVYDAQGDQPQVALLPVARRNDGRFEAAASRLEADVPRDPRGLLLEDLDGDGHLDALVSSCTTNTLALRRGPLAEGGIATASMAALGCPSALRTADLDGDGRPDVATLTAEPGAVQTRLGRAAGGFSLPVSYRMQRAPRALVLADFDRDGHVDLLTGSADLDCEPDDDGLQEMPCEGTPKSRLFLRWGRGPRGFDFQRPVIPPLRPGIDPPAAAVNPDVDTGIGAEHLAVADVDLDGLPDLVAAQGGAFRVLRGTGDRRTPFAWFGVSRDQPARAGQVVTDVAVADVDADARPDLVLATATDDGARGGLQTWLGQGDGSFVRLENLDAEALSALHLGDLSGDGRPDAAALSASGAVVRFDGLGGGRMGPAATVALLDGAGSFAIADADRDGAQDLLGVASGRGGEGLFLKRGVGRQAFGLERPPLRTALGPIGTVLLDFDRNGAVDLAVLNEEARSLSLFRGDGRGGFSPGPGPFALDLHPSDGLAEDLDADGWTDLIVTDAGGQNRQVLRGDRGTFVVDEAAYTPGNAFGFFDPRNACFGPVFPRERLMAVDLDGNGTRDLLHAHAGTIGRFAIAAYDYHSDFGSRGVLPFDADCGAGFTVWDVNGSLRPVAFSGGTANVNVLMPQGPTTLLPVRVGRAIEDYGEEEWARVLRTADLSRIEPWQIWGNGLETADFDDDGRDELVVFGQVDDKRYSLVFIPPGHSVLDQRAMQLSAIGGWADQFEGSGFVRLSPRLADLNGDGLADEIGALPGRNVLNVRLRRSFAEGFSDQDEVLPVTRALPAGVEVGDATGDGVPDLFVPNLGDDTVSFLELPGPGEWTQTLLDPNVGPMKLDEAPDDPEAPGLKKLGEVRQAFQMVDHIAVTTRIDGSGLDGLTLSLRAPSGQRITLGRGPANGSWRAFFSAPRVDFERLYGRQPTGFWTLLAEMGPGAAGELRDFRVTTHGAFVRPSPGFDPRHPRPALFPIAATGRALRDTTLGGRDSADLSCADTGGGQPDRWYQGELGAATELSVQLAAGHDAAVELRAGACAAAGPVRGCAAGRSARIAPVALEAGPFCVVVDGVSAGRGIQAGGFDLFLRLSEAAPDPCANGGCPPEPDAGLPPLDAALPDEDAALLPDAAPPPPDAAVPEQDAGVAGEVMCAGSSCAQVCCVGFFGVHCAPGCGLGELPALCDGPEDCPQGQRCCASTQTGARCAAACGGIESEVCHRDVECSAGSCISCNFPGIGSLQMCRVDGCP